jgi:exosortase family protein XrtF
MNPSQKKISKFVVTLIGCYLLVYLLYQYLLLPFTSLDSHIIHSLIQLSHQLLLFLQYESFSDPTYAIVGINGTSGVNVGYACDGLSLFLLYSVFILVFPGKFSLKIAYLVMGCVFIHALNVFRITALAIIHYSDPELLHFHHTYTFTLLIYGIIFTIWMSRVKIYTAKQW